MTSWLRELGKGWIARRSARTAPVAEGELVSWLEQRLALYASPMLDNLPDLADMADRRNTVVRLATSAGNIDIELYDIGGPTPTALPAPTTANNFLKYVNSGRYDGTFFHRRTAQRFVLQGGAFALKDPVPGSAPRFDTIPTDPPIQNEFSATRSNIARTLAMAKLGTSPNSATNQFFFNLEDNSSNLNEQNGGFSVFARVIKGWDVVERIVSFSVSNLSSFYSGNPNDPTFTEVPLSGSNNTDVVVIRDAEVIKAARVEAFYQYSAFFADGFRSRSVTADVQMVNADLTNSANFQIIARYETGRRDGIILTGVMEPGGSRNVRVSEGGNPSINRVRVNVGFGYEVRSTRPIAAQWTQRDFGTIATGSFINPGSFTAAQLRDWSFASGLKGPGVASFLSWVNMAQDPVTVDVTFTSETGQVYTISKTTQGNRRGGLIVGELAGVPDGGYSVRISSSQPIAAALSQYRSIPSRAAVETGVPAGGANAGVLPAAIIPSNGQSSLTFLAIQGTGFTTATVDLEFVLENGTTLQSIAPIVLTTSIPRREVDLAGLNLSLPRDQYFTVRYSVREARTPVIGSYASTTPENTRRASFQTHSTEKVYFAGGFLAPASSEDNDVVSIYNPYAASAGVTVSYQVKFHFLSGPQQEVIAPASATGTLTARGRVDISVRSINEVVARLSQGGAQRWFAISIETTITGGSSEARPGAIFAQLTRTGSGGFTTTGPGLDGLASAVAITDPRFGT